jgi:3-hydroxyisobutyrate dehydrogenase-like beta-hydroxyacid dehydrogenase
MGSEIVTRLTSRGLTVCGWDINEQQRRAAADRGAQIAADCRSLFASCRRIVLSLPSHETVAEVLQDVVLSPGQAIVDTTTGSVEAAEQMARQCEQFQSHYIDATISGSSVQLRDAKAVLLVGASPDAFELTLDILSALSPKLFHVGAPGAGARMKLVTNLVLGLNRAALAEGLAFAKRQGLDLELTLGLLRETLAYSRIMDTKGEKMIQEDFAPQARLSQHLKDVRLMLETAQSHGISLPLTEAHRQLLQRAEELGLGQLDNSALIMSYYER